MRHGSDKLIFLSLIMNYPGPQHGETVDRGVFCVSIALSLWQQHDKDQRVSHITIKSSAWKPMFFLFSAKQWRKNERLHWNFFLVCYIILLTQFFRVRFIRGSRNYSQEEMRGKFFFVCQVGWDGCPRQFFH